MIVWLEVAKSVCTALVVIEIILAAVVIIYCARMAREQKGELMSND